MCREVEQYAHRLGAVVSQFIVDSLGCPSQDWAGAGQCWQIDWRTCSWAAAASAIFQSAFMSLLMSREARERGLERRRGERRQPCALIDSATNAQHGKCIIYL